MVSQAQGFHSKLPVQNVLDLVYLLVSVFRVYKSVGCSCVITFQPRSCSISCKTTVIQSLCVCWVHRAAGCPKGGNCVLKFRLVQDASSYSLWPPTLPPHLFHFLLFFNIWLLLPARSSKMSTLRHWHQRPHHRYQIRKTSFGAK